MPHNLTRREFVRDLGLVGTGLAIASTGAIGSAFADDAKPTAVPRRFWWVKDVDKATTEVDWKLTKRFSYLKTVLGPALADEYIGKDRFDKLNQIQKSNAKKWETEGKPGYTTKDIALDLAVKPFHWPVSFLGLQRTATPEMRGVPKYKGTPEENAQMLTVAMRLLGAATVGFLELDDNTKKLVYEIDTDGKRIEFEDADKGYETEEKRVLPNNAKWAMVYTVQMSNENIRMAPTALSGYSSSMGYSRNNWLQTQFQEFMRALGYNAYGQIAPYNSLALAPAMGALCGIGEMSRINRLITPEYGSAARVFKMIIDIPVQPTKPIDFGVMKFCKTCKKCAIECPPRALSFDTEPSWETRGGWNNPGHRAYFEDSSSCRSYWFEVASGCSICLSACPYNREDEASIHRLWQATQAKTGLLGGVTTKADDLFYGNGIKDPVEYWNQNHFEYGLDTTKGHKK